MPNQKGGKKFKRNKKVHAETKLIYKNLKENEEYAKIKQKLGNGRFNLECIDGKDRIGIIAGKLRKRLWMDIGDIVLISLWEFSTNSDKCSIIHKYQVDEVNKLISEGEIPKNIYNEENDDNFECLSFDYSDILSDKSNESDESDEDNNDKNIELLDNEININDI